MQWQDVCETPSLKNLPFKIELNKQGQLLMTPVNVNHSLLQGKMIGLFYRHLQNGEALAECAIHTSKGTKVADVAWASYERLAIIRNEVECSIAPEICVEIMSAANSRHEMLEKKLCISSAALPRSGFATIKAILNFFRRLAKSSLRNLRQIFRRQCNAVGAAPSATDVVDNL